MKPKIIILSLITGFFSYTVMGQDTSENQRLSVNQTYHTGTPEVNYTNASLPHIYRDTRLGGSSPLYNTYKKNDYGAGTVTTSPHKTGSSINYNSNIFNTPIQQSAIYRDTRLGGSSPGHRTYKTNDYGAGAITTNPNK